LFLAVLPCGGGEQTRLSYSSLRGAPEIYVGVEYLNSDLQREGLDQNVLKDDVVSRLRRAHIPLAKHPAACLCVNLTAVRVLGADTWAYALDVSFEQGMKLLRDETIQSSGRTWHAGTALGVVPASDLSSTIRKKIGNKIDAFIRK
jgi:hypothetical protein